ncbi:MAG: thioredoxin [Clostridia bacterium]|nr:thioredoxin [Clostridia bacterium]MBR3806477.1 thioredoxin [Clostridia bacterium]
MAAIVNKDTFDSIILGEKLTLVDFYADWCGPCRMVAPTVEEIAAERTDINVVKVNVDNSPELAVRYGVSSIPTLIVFKGGEPKAKAVGVKTKAQLIDMIDGK